MDITVSDQELEIICDALQQIETQAADATDPDDERLKETRKLFQRLQTLRTAK